MDTEREVALRHPLYLDVPMMMSYLAYLTDGVASTVEQTTSSAYTADRGRNLEGGLSIPAGGLANVNFSGRFANSGANEGSDEQRVTRQHTSASLFNVLLDYLNNRNMVETVSPDGLSNTPAGTLIRCSGKFVGNPLEALLDLANQFLPFFDASNSAGSSVGEPSKQSGNPAKKAAAGRGRSPEDRAALAAQRDEEESQQFGLRLIRQLRTDLRESPVADILLESSAGLNVVATLSREFFTDQVSAQLRSSTATVIGKVTLVEETDSLNLLRRTVLVMADDETRTSMFAAFGSLPGLSGTTDQLIVSPPLIQVMPLAIYI